MQICEMTALELAEKIRQKEITAPQAVEAVAKAVEQRDETYNCYISFDKESALQNAENVQNKINSGEDVGILAGVPIGIKDNICVKGQPTTCASKMLENFVPPYDATVINKLYDGGMIPLGKLNMDEFAMGSTTETSLFGETKNPWNIAHVPGGSSGGAAAAVAAKEAIAALGSDTGGSIRQPCSFCGVTGLKPTYGAVSRYGAVAYASSLDQIGSIGKTAADVAAIFSVIEGKDVKDATSANTTPINVADIYSSVDVKGKTVGIPKDFFSDGINEDVAARVMEASNVLRSLGAKIEHFSMPIVKYAVPTYFVISCAEASSNLARFDGIKYGYKSPNAKNLSDIYLKSRSESFGREVQKRVMLGNFVLSSGYYDAYYVKALQSKALICRAFEDAFEKYDFILGPVAPATAPKLGSSLSDPMEMYLGDIYTVMVNIAGLPALALPCGFDKGGMPIGMQLIGRPFEESTILSAGNAFQSVTDFHKQSPALI